MLDYNDDLDKMTIGELLERTAKTCEHQNALNFKVNGKWEFISWKEYYELTCLIGRAFCQLGLRRGEGVSIIGFNCVEWVVSDLAAIMGGGVPVGIYTTSSPDQCYFLIKHSDSSIVVVEDQVQLEKIKKIRPKLSELKAIVLMKGEDDDPMVHSWEDLPSIGKKFSEEEFQKKREEQKPEDLATLVYTSGTTAKPKGVMLSHKNLIYNTGKTITQFYTDRDETILSYLPLSHVAEQEITIIGTMIVGGQVFFAESMENLGENLREVRPTLFLGVPRIWEKIQEKMMMAGAQSGPVRKFIIKWAKKVGLESGYREQKGLPKTFSYKLADMLIFSKVKKQLGFDRCRYQLTGAAPISKETLEFFMSLGLPLCEVFGMSECAGTATFSTPERTKLGSAGVKLPHVEVQIADDGEILIRGLNVFIGYFKDEKATKGTLDEKNWLHTGDVGHIDKEGFLFITDRKKDIIITAGGENIAPQMIEGKINQIQLIGHSVVIGDKKKFLTALITINHETVESFLAPLGVDKKENFEEYSKDPKIRSYLEEEITKMNKGLARVQTIKKFIILPKFFDVSTGELTPTMKLKRKFIMMKYAKDVEDLYKNLT
ncbi:MAG: AMP-binding protein [Bdellovibrionota bacterium]|nr:AMP-binding protein [Bdellovibrionota bacterium]